MEYGCAYSFVAAPTTAETTAAAAAHLGSSRTIFSHIFSIRIWKFSESSVQHPSYSFRKRVGKKKKHRAGKTTSSGSAVTAAVAAAAAEAAAAEASRSSSSSGSRRSRSSRRCRKHQRTSTYIRQYTIYFGLIFEDEKTAPSSSDFRHCDYPTHVQQQRYSYQVPQLRYLP